MYMNLNPADVGVRGDFDETVRLAVRHGFEGIDMPRHDIAEMAQPEAANEKVAAANLRWGSFALGVAIGDSQPEYEASVTLLRQHAPIAASLGCKRAIACITPGDNERNDAANWKLHVERLRPAVEILLPLDIRLGLEFIGPKTLRETFRYPFIYTMGRMLELCNAITTSGEPGRVGLLLDSFHWFTSGATEDDLLALSNHNIVYVHANDGYAGRSRDEQMDLERALPCDTGVIDLATFVNALRTVQYDGPVAAEPFMPELENAPDDESVGRTADAMRKMWAL